MSKRQATVQLNKDDWEAQQAKDDEDRYGPPIIPGTWQKADDAVIAQRKIRKAKRPTGGTAGSLPLPPTNPFANVEFAAPPTAAAGNPFANIQLTAPTVNPFANAANPFANVQLKAQKTSAESSVPLAFNPFAPLSNPFVKHMADPGDKLRERMHAVRRARMNMM